MDFLLSARTVVGIGDVEEYLQYIRIRLGRALSAKLIFGDHHESFFGKVKNKFFDHSGMNGLICIRSCYLRLRGLV